LALPQPLHNDFTHAHNAHAGAFQRARRAKAGLQLDRFNGRSRPLLRACLDWSERRSHLAGTLGATILERLLDLRYARRVRDSRAVILSPRGEAFIARLETSA